MKREAYLICQMFIQTGLLTVFFYVLDIVYSLLGVGIAIAPFILAVLAGVKLALFFILLLLMRMQMGIMYTGLSILLTSLITTMIITLRFGGDIGTNWLILLALLLLSDAMAHIMLRVCGARPDGGQEQ